MEQHESSSPHSLHLFENIYTTTTKLWNTWSQEDWYQRDVVHPLNTRKEAGRSLADLVEDKTVEGLSQAFPDIICHEMTEHGQVVPRSMGDFWVRTPSGCEPVNIKAMVDGSGNLNVVALNRLLSYVAVESISSYWVLGIRFHRNEPQHTKVVMFDLLQHLDELHYDNGAGGIALNKNTVNQLFEGQKFPDKPFQKEEAVQALYRIHCDGYERLKLQREKTHKQLSRIVEGDYRQVKRLYVQSVNNKDIFDLDSKIPAKRSVGQPRLFHEADIERKLVALIIKEPDLVWSDFERYGEEQLLDAIRRTGGLTIWRARAERVIEGQTGRAKQRGAKKYWDHETIIRALTLFMKDYPDPTLNDVREHGPVGLASAIHRGPGIDYYKGVVRSQQASDKPQKKKAKHFKTEARKWEYQLILEALAEVMRVYPFPTKRNIQDYPEPGLYGAMCYRDIDGIQAWAKLVWDAGLVERPEGTWPARYNTEEDIEDRLIDFLNGCPYADRSDFVKHGEQKLWEAIKIRGGIELWRERVNNRLDKPMDLTRQWPDDRILMELRKVVEQCPNPRKQDVLEFGRRGLHRAIEKNGGLTLWLARLAEEDS